MVMGGVGSQLNQPCIDGSLSQTRTPPHAHITLVGRTKALHKTAVRVVLNVVLIGVGLDGKLQFRFYKTVTNKIS